MLRMLSARRMCLCHTVNHTIYIIERRGGFARRDGVRVERIRCGLLSVKRRCGASVWTDSSTSCAPSRTRRAAENGPWNGRTAVRGGQRDSGSLRRARPVGSGSRARRADRRWRCRFRSRACAGVTPRSGELRTCTCRPVPWARRGHISHICRCVALTGISHTRAGLRRKPGRDGRRNI